MSSKIKMQLTYKHQITTSITTFKAKIFTKRKHINKTTDNLLTTKFLATATKTHYSETLGTVHTFRIPKINSTLENNFKLFKFIH